MAEVGDWGGKPKPEPLVLLLPPAPTPTPVPEPEMAEGRCLRPSLAVLGCEDVDVLSEA